MVYTRLITIESSDSDLEKVLVTYQKQFEKGLNIVSPNIQSKTLNLDNKNH